MQQNIMYTQLVSVKNKNGHGFDMMRFNYMNYLCDLISDSTVVLHADDSLDNWSVVSGHNILY